MTIRFCWVLVPTVILTGCTSTIRPVAVPLAASMPKIELCAPVDDQEAQDDSSEIYSNVSPRDRLRYMVCALHSKADANLKQAEQWQNRSEWRDIPLLGAAATVAGLLLFGKRDANNALKKGEQETITGVAFGAATFSTFANYLSPQKARELLRQGGRGHFCMATQGELVLSVYDAVERPTEHDDLVDSLADLSGRLAADPSQFAKPDEARAVRDAAATALATYDTQIRQLDTAAIVLGETAWNFGIDLMTRSDRSGQQVDALVKAITDQTTSVTKFATTEQRATDPVPKAVVQSFLAMPRAQNARATSDQLTILVANRTALLLDGLVNVEALVLGFEKCAATALTGGSPRADRVQRVTLR